MNKAAVVLQTNSISQETFFTEAQTRQKKCLFVHVTAEFAALFCTAFKSHPYNASAAESLSVQWKGSPVHWNPARVQWKDQLRALESWSSHLQVTRIPERRSLGIVWPLFGGRDEVLRNGQNLFAQIGATGIGVDAGPAATVVVVSGLRG